VVTNCCKKLVSDLHYEARVQAVRNYYATVLGQKVTKEEARTIYLTPEQYRRVRA
jgi:hypothetical protein